MRRHDAGDHQLRFEEIDRGARALEAFDIPREAVPSSFHAFRERLREETSRLEVNDDARRIGRLVLAPRYIRVPRLEVVVDWIIEHT